ncbi:16S rRNA (guanine(527)-N(7))-methyltransferase RsmG [Corynebacterium sp. SY003]|uniref:16S rRNA (guanine(527)-N(7))-methyltransferase RsmG n=2 Tax=unclassified Corynebacterium TaxID=2624378 RepID=UPI00351ABB98
MMNTMHNVDAYGNEIVTSPEILTLVEDIFGTHAEKAIEYHRLLATDGSIRGFMGPREIPKLWDRHILNCAVISELVPIAGQPTIVDIGSGAGLPGIPLALARPDIDIFLVEPLLKRATFLQEVSEKLALENVQVIRGRAEEKTVKKQIGSVDLVTSRAVAPLGKLAGWSLPLCKKHGAMIAMKGTTVREEIARDAALIKKAGGGTAEVLVVGKQLTQPTTVVRIPKLDSIKK